MINPTQLRLMFLSVLLVLTACGGSGADKGSSNPNSEGTSSGLSGLITLDSTDLGHYKGVYSFRLSNGSVTSKGVLEAEGRKPSRHPKGKIVFKKECGGVNKNEIAILKTDGIITPVTPCITDLAPILQNTLPYYVSLPYYGRAKLSPDESLIAVEIDYRGGDDGLEDKTFILVFDMSGTIQHRYDDAFNPAWLPDGRLLVVSTLGNGDQMFITDDSLNDLTLIKNKPLGSSVNYVDISSSGKKLVFVYNFQIWIMNIDGSGLKRLITKRNSRLKDPTWSPNEKYIAYFSTSDDNPTLGYDKKINFFEIESGKTSELKTDGNVFRNDRAFSFHPRGPLTWTN